MIEEGIDSLESEEERTAAAAALATLALLGVFESQQKYDVAQLIVGAPDESIEQIAARILGVRRTNGYLTELADLGRSYMKKD